MQKNKNIEFFGFSTMSFFRSAQPIWGPGKSTNKTKKIGSEAVFSRNDSNHEPNSKANRTSKKNGTQRAKTSKTKNKTDEVQAARQVVEARCSSTGPTPLERRKGTPPFWRRSQRQSKPSSAYPLHAPSTFATLGSHRAPNTWSSCPWYARPFWSDRQKLWQWKRRPPNLRAPYCLQVRTPWNSHGHRRNLAGGGF